MKKKNLHSLGLNSAPKHHLLQGFLEPLSKSRVSNLKQALLLKTNVLNEAGFDSFIESSVHWKSNLIKIPPCSFSPLALGSQELKSPWIDKGCFMNDHACLLSLQPGILCGSMGKLSLQDSQLFWRKVFPGGERRLGQLPSFQPAVDMPFLFSCDLQAVDWCLCTHVSSQGGTHQHIGAQGCTLGSHTNAIQAETEESTPATDALSLACQESSGNICIPSQSPEYTSWHTQLQLAWARDSMEFLHMI